MKNLEYARPKGAGADAYLPIPLVSSSRQALVLGPTTTQEAKHTLHADTALVRVVATLYPVFISFSTVIDKSYAQALGTLTSDATNVTDGDTVTIDTVVYRFKDTMAQAYDVKRGASAAATLDNLKAAINASGTAGTEYFTGTLEHPTVYATTNTDTTQVVVAKTYGTAGNSIATTENSTHLSWGAATLASGGNADFDAYCAVGQTLDIARHDDITALTFIGDGGTASVAVIEY